MDFDQTSQECSADREPGTELAVKSATTARMKLHERSATR
jgi:hypothetical protein